MAIVIFFLVLIYLAMILVVPIYAKIKGENPLAWFLAAIVLTPFFTLSMIRARGRNKEQKRDKEIPQKALPSSYISLNGQDEK